jgi:hypothetical protein
MIRFFVLFILVLAVLLSACGRLEGDYLNFATADPRVNVAMRLLPPPPPLPTVEPQVAPCDIKVNWNGTEWIYHLPGQASYMRTLIEPSKGEAFVCSEEEAQAAGARKALR